MQKHRKKTHYKKMTIAFATAGIVGIPAVAMACLNTQEPGTTKAASQRTVRPSDSVPAANAAQKHKSDEDRQGHPGRGHGARPTAKSTHGTKKAKPATAKPRPTATKPATAKPRPTATKPATAKPKPTATKPPTTSTVPTSGDVAQVLALVNKERANAGCSALTINAKLMSAAQNHSEDMAAHSNMSHTGSDGSDPGQRITRAGYDWRTYGENVAYGYSTAAKVMDGWMNSPGHRRNILNCSFKEIGIGLAQPNYYWTQAFGAR
ncbi:CAP domain-containing protein [Streptomyces sp. NPDC006879]|uniref:CAP domain-containing protein n=1 Tax=Streptomyces sp. NPDC006879 TaxID=3364767 RepID=UPI0036CE1270